MLFLNSALLVNLVLGSTLEHDALGSILEHDVTPDGRVGWVKGGRANGTTPIELVVAVSSPSSAITQLKLLHAAVSDPRSSQYGSFLTNERVHELLAPASKDISNLRAHLALHGMSTVEVTPNRGFLVAHTTISAAEKALGCEYYEYRHESGVVAVRTPHYSLPTGLARVVDFVSPTVRLPSLESPRAHKADLGSGLLGNSPKSLRALYSVGDTVGAADNNKQAVTGFLNQHFSQKDLNEFHTLFDHLNKGQVLATKGDGPTGLISGTEAMLDAEYMPALGANISTEFWGFTGAAPDNKQNEPFLKWLYLVSNTTDANVPKLFSTSYGEDEASVSEAYADRINIEFVKAGVRGISLLFASGDGGAACGTDKKFHPNWPATSPYVTGVGGTTGSNPEQAVGLSSGGFSNRYSTPAWQTGAVATYLAGSNVPDHSFFNSSGRGFPDIAAQAEGFTVVSNRIPEPGVAGTSCASPTAAGVFGLLNDLRLQAGKPTLGFLNPFLYQLKAGALTDITEGASGSGCGSVLTKGFPAVVGWDPVTGLGTPNFEELAKAVRALP